MNVRLTAALAFAAGAALVICTAAACVPDDGIERYSDGSWSNSATGESGCDPAGTCASVPAPPEGTPTTPNGGYYPTLTLVACANEDSDNCYWDAARMGNGQGTSFITVGGVTYYPEAGS